MTEGALEALEMGDVSGGDDGGGGGAVEDDDDDDDDDNEDDVYLDDITVNGSDVSFSKKTRVTSYRPTSSFLPISRYTRSRRWCR